MLNVTYKIFSSFIYNGMAGNTDVDLEQAGPHICDESND